MLKTICEKNTCTACGACICICPGKCISFKSDEYGMRSAYLDAEQCYDCGLCHKVCPVDKNADGNISNACYAAWSLDKKIRNQSASGGVATEFYKYAIEKGYWIAGVKMNDDFEANYSLTNNNYTQFQNSKYTFSFMNEIYIEIFDKLRKNQNVLFIGLPCQVAALKSFLQAKNVNEENLITVDLVCHGIMPENYLKQHIQRIIQRKEKMVSKVAFRNPKYGTYRYCFTLSNYSNVFYKKTVNQDDEYQIAYHRGIAYRENCYLCPWAKRERMGDITLSDFTGVGTKEKVSYSDKNVSCVMTNTTKGARWYREFIQEERLFSDPRPVEENCDSQMTLNHPTSIPIEREVFLNCYKKTESFDDSMQVAAKKIICYNRLNTYTRYRDIKILLLRLLPRSVKDKIKKLVIR